MGIERHSKCFYKCNSCKNINLVPEDWGGQLVDYFVYTNKLDTPVTVTLYSNGNSEIFVNDESTNLYATPLGVAVTVPAKAVIKVKNQVTDGSGDYPLVDCSNEYGGCLELTKVNRFCLLTNTFSESIAIGSIDENAFSEIEGEISTTGLFCYCRYLKDIPSNFLFIRKSVDTSYMFYGCTSLESVPYIDLPNVIDANNMFANCTSLVSIGYSINMPSLVNANRMFYGCSRLTEIPFSFNTLKNVTRADYMFSGCTSLLRTPNTWEGIGNAANINYMFSGCTNLESIPTSWNKIKATELVEVFADCSSLITIPTSWEGLENVTNIEGLFENCSRLTYIPNSWNGLGNVRYMQGAFLGCSNIANGGRNDIETLNKVYDCIDAFYDVYDLPNAFDLFKQLYKVATYGNNCFKNCTNDADKILTAWGGTLDVDSLTEYYNNSSGFMLRLRSKTAFSWYYGNIYQGESTKSSDDNYFAVVTMGQHQTVKTKGQTTKYDGSPSDLDSIIDCEYNYDGQEVIVKHLGTELSKDLRCAFGGCRLIQHFDFRLLSPNCITDAVKYAFYKCPNFTQASFAGANNTGLTSFESTFESSGVSSIFSFEGLEKAVNFRRMFYNCTSLTSIPKIERLGISNINDADVSMESMFENCSNVVSVGGMSGDVWSKVIDKLGRLNASKLFKNCTKLYLGINPNEISENSVSCMLYNSFMYNCGFVRDGVVIAEGYMKIEDAEVLYAESFSGTGGETSAQKQISEIDTLASKSVAVRDIMTYQSVNVLLIFML